MRIVILGGTGLIGKALANCLYADRHDVCAVSRHPSPAGLDAGIRQARWDGASAKGWSTEVEGCDIVINLAGESLAGSSLTGIRWTAERKEKIRASRVQAGQAVCDAVRSVQRKPALVVQASAVGFYGTDAKGRILTEESPSGDDFLASVCREWEASTEPVEDEGVRRIILRLGVVLSNAGGALPRQALPFRLFAGGRLGNGRQWVSWIHIDDICEALRFLINQENATGAYNLCAPEPVQNSAFTQALGKALDRPAWIPVPGIVLATLLGEAATILLDGQRVVPQRLTAAGYPFRHPHIDGALEDIYHHK